MRNRKYRSLIAMVLSLCMVLQMNGYNAAAEEGAVPELEELSAGTPADDSPIRILSVTGSAITYYIGGAGASDGNVGTDAAESFATLAKAASMIVNEGSYEILVLGDTVENQLSRIGNGSDDIDVTIRTVTGSAIIQRSNTCTGDLITVTENASLILGDSTASYTSELSIHGGHFIHYEDAYGSLVYVDQGGELIVYPRVTIERNKNLDYSNPVKGSGIHNKGIFLMYGGTIQHNYVSYEYGAGVYNTGTFRMYGGSINDNHYTSYGAGVFNDEGGTFEMYGGEIRHNDSDSYAGGIGNAGTFRLFDGTIEDNYANSNGGIYNFSEGIIYMYGGLINANRSDYTSAGISNGGSFYMSGGTISNHHCTMTGAGVSNYALFIMTGGTIEGNSSPDGGGVYIYEDALFVMTGGIIQNNTGIYGGAVHNEGEFIISGSANIPGGAGNTNNIYLLSPITLGEVFTGSDTMAITLEDYSKEVGNQWIKEITPGILEGCYSMFQSTNSRYPINEEGVIESDFLPFTYYVGGVGASDANEGTSADAPFATLQHAFDIGNDATSTFILQSDIEIDRTIITKGNITIKSNGNAVKVVRSTDFTGNRIFELDSGVLNLGDTTNTGAADTLVFDGEDTDGMATFILITGDGAVNVYSGTTIENYITDYNVIDNYNKLNLYGGTLRNNNPNYSVIYNSDFAVFTMSGGTIHDNEGPGITNDNELYLSGGSITDNTPGNIYNDSVMHFSGNPEISSGNPSDYDIYMANSAGAIVLEGVLNYQGQIRILRDTYTHGDQLLSGSSRLILQNYMKFELQDPNYGISIDGLIMYKMPVNNYYVNAAGSDDNDGSINLPFATLQKAMDEIGDGVGTVILQSDITLHEPAVIEGTVTLISNGYQQTMRRGEPYERYDNVDESISTEAMLVVLGSLILGSRDNYGSDEAPGLILDGGSEEGHIGNNEIILNTGALDLYSGVVIQNNVSDNGSIFNEGGRVRMYGGLLRNSSGDFGGVLSFRGQILMAGGSIRDNIAEETGIISIEGDVIIAGGNISNNSSDRLSGVMVNRGKLTMSAGSITGNSGGNCGVIVDDGEFHMSGGDISNNSGSRIAGAAVNGRYSMTGGSIRSNGGISTHVLLFAGAYVVGEFLMSGGEITGNSGVYGGASIFEGPYLDCDVPFRMTGGKISGNTGSWGLSGAYVEEAHYIELSGKALIEDGDKLMLSDETSIIINAPLTSKTFTATIGIYDELDITEEIMVPSYQIGRQLLVPGDGYTFTPADVKKLTLLDPIYGINPEGRIRTAIRDNWITISGDSNLYYDAFPATVYITVMDSGVTLDYGTDYILSYSDNINAGSAYVTITGIGSYAGNITKGFTIKRVTALSILSKVSENLTVYMEDGKTVEAVIQSILPLSVIVDIGIGTYLLPITWSVTDGSYDPKGSVYTYTGTVEGDNNVDANGLTITTHITVKPLYENTAVSKFVNTELLNKAKETGEDLIISIKDSNQRLRYSWTFSSKDIKNSDSDISDIDLTLEVAGFDTIDEFNRILDRKPDTGAAASKEDFHGLILSFGHDGELPIQASVKIYVGNQKGITSGSRIYLYHYNPDTGKLETLPFSSEYVVDEDGYITVNIIHCSDYVVLPREADSNMITSLRKQISVAAEKETVYVGGTKDTKTSILLELPATLELVKDLKDKTSKSAIGAVKAVYRSSNAKVAAVDSKGIITAVGTGLTTIYTTVTLYSGKEITYKTILRVREPYITVSGSTGSMKVGDTFTFKAKVYGLDAGDIIWTTTKRSIVTINKKTGKAAALSAGTDYVVITIGGIKKKIKVVVK